MASEIRSRSATQLVPRGEKRSRPNGSRDVPAHRGRKVGEVSRQWAMDENDLNLLASHMKPGMRVLEAGVGRSAGVVGKAGGNVLSPGRDDFYWEMALQWVRDGGVIGNVRVELTGTRLFPSPVGLLPWYDAALDGKFDFILVDGPPMKIGRKAAGFQLLPHLLEEGELWLDEIGRASSKEREEA